MTPDSPHATPHTEPSPEGSGATDAYHDSSETDLGELPGPQERPVSILFNDTAYATVLATPDQLEALAVGFAFSEGVIDRYADIASLACESSRHGHRVRLNVAARIERRAAGQARATTTTSGCGACGVQEESQLLFGLTRLAPANPPAPAALRSGLAALQDRAESGMHLALSFAADGELIAAGRDIGRHNALDKVIGEGLRQGRQAAWAMTSSRCSLELVQKSVRAGIATLATLSYPSRLAVEVARACNLTLINCHRGRRLELLSRGDR